MEWKFVAGLGMAFLLVVLAGCTQSPGPAPGSNAVDNTAWIPQDTSPQNGPDSNVPGDENVFVPPADVPTGGVNGENTAIPNDNVPPIPPAIVEAGDLAVHATIESCWVVFEGKVFDVTEWIPRHPGGEQAIAAHCGKTTFEAAFVAQHGRSKVQSLMENAVVVGGWPEN